LHLGLSLPAWVEIVAFSASHLLSGVSLMMAQMGVVFLFFMLQELLWRLGREKKHIIDAMLALGIFGGLFYSRI
jgi:hypothetical protein